MAGRPQRRLDASDAADCGATATNEELDLFDRLGLARPRLISRTPFADWWWEEI